MTQKPPNASLYDYFVVIDEIIRYAQIERASAVLIEIETAFPIAGAMIRATMQHSPQRALETLAVFMPSIKSIPNAENVIALIQQKVRNQKLCTN